MRPRLHCPMFRLGYPRQPAPCSEPPTQARAECGWDYSQRRGPDKTEIVSASLVSPKPVSRDRGPNAAETTSALCSFDGLSPESATGHRRLAAGSRLSILRRSSTRATRDECSGEYI